MKHLSRATALPFIAILVSLALVSCDNGEQAIDEPVVSELRILQPFPDGAEHDPFKRPQPTLHDILTRVWEATDNENVKGLFLRVGSLQGAWGSVGDLSEALAAFRTETRPVHCHFESADNVGYLLLASTCDRVTMSPAGMLNLVGPAAVMIYARSFLDKVGIEAEILHMGRYKGAGDMFVRDDMPEEAKESMDAILDVPVTIAMEIGRSRINIRNLLQLNQGSVVELDRLAGEPMDVLVNGTLIAQGEVVVVNEKFGIRLTDIVSPADRIKKLGH